ncbi:MAG: hypothetical protein IJ747_03575 [Lachnospiraceae bacterium]|nr:hypothetical protein [Lachnospiraceae bacterium]
MDGQNLQNENEQLNSQQTPAQEPVVNPAGAVDNAAQTGNVYQNNNDQSGAYQGNAEQSNSYQSNTYQSNTYQNNTFQSNPYQSNTYQSNTTAAPDNSYQSSIVTPDNNYQSNSYQSNSYQNNTYQNNSYQPNTYQNTNTYQDNTAQYNTYTGPTPEVYGEPDAPKTPGVAVASLILGIAGIVFSCCCGAGVLFGIIGLILAIVGNKEQKTGVGTGGLVCSIIAIVLSLLGVIGTFALGGLESFSSMM